MAIGCIGIGACIAAAVYADTFSTAAKPCSPAWYRSMFLAYKLLDAKASCFLMWHLTTGMSAKIYFSYASAYLPIPRKPFTSKGLRGIFLACHVVLQRVEVVSVFLHHIASLIEMESAVVGGSNLIFLHVGKLHFDHIRSEPLFVQECASDGAEAVDAHLISTVTKATETVQKTDVAYAL